jgi:uncharacterized glyoxalase superfamily protein PhnB
VKGLDVAPCRFRWLKQAMHAHVHEPVGTIVPTLRYRDVAAAVDWLCKAFAFERHLVVRGDDGAVRYAELTFGGGMIMLGPVEDSAFGGLMLQPQDAGGAETQICYLFVEDAAAHCTRAKAAGAEIVLDIEKADGSGRGYSCRDLEGHIWNFGTYNPWKRRAVQPGRSERRPATAGLGRAVLVSGLLLATAASAVVVAWGMGGVERSQHEPMAVQSTRTQTDPIEAAERTIREAREQLAKERSAKEAAERVAKQAEAQLAQERAAREAAERTAREARERLAMAGAEQAVEEARAAREQLARERSALEAAQRIALQTREQLGLTERAAEAVREELAAERSARLAAERARQQALQELAHVRNAKEAARGGEREERERLAKEHAAREAKEHKETAERAAKEARERQQRNVRRPAPRAQVAEPSPGISPYTIWPK